MLTEKLLRVTVAGGSEWVMVLLLLLSVLSLALAAERFLFFRRKRRALDALDEALTPLLGGGDAKRLEKTILDSADPTITAALAGRSPADRDAAERIVASSLARERLRLERRLTFLGTLGSNAPFVGLFGTVLGIIRAFNDLSMGSTTGTKAVMAGISEALVATAVGLFVAIPAVIAFNYFQKQVDHALSITEALAQAVLAGAPGRATASREEAPAPRSSAQGA
ncbi:MAG: MotA/TolQ/ExbB proton channel family protein [Deltaproteobacteria bacterium]|nr:MotA/TolQ/ExbB proton channel family protein [Deltaproteobacteria bacterium]